MSKIIVFFIIALVGGCSDSTPADSTQTVGKSHSSEAMNYDQEVEIEPPRTAEPPAPDQLEVGTKLIKTGNLNFDVSDLEESKSQVDSLIKAFDAYYESERYHSYGNRVSYYLLIRVPNEEFDPLVESMEDGVGKLQSKNINVQDVTEEYVDLNIRLENNLAYLEQYKAILKRATTTKDILEVQEKIRRIEEEIESKKGRLKFLDSRVKHSILEVEITELVSRSLGDKPGFGIRVTNAFKNGVELFQTFLLFLINLWPFFILALVILIFRKPIVGFFDRRA